ncbi:hypothetical protein SLA2020_160760 [Shorea laevis]
MSCTTMIAGLCSLENVSEAHYLFEEMPQKGIFHDLITFHTMIQGFCNPGKIVESRICWMNSWSSVYNHLLLLMLLLSKSCVRWVTCKEPQCC